MRENGFRVYAATALIAASTLMLEILLTRITSVVAWYHMSFFVISLAMLGMTAGAVIVFLFPARFTREQAARRMSEGCLGLALAGPLCISVALALPVVQLHESLPFLALLLYGMLLAVPFLFSGIALTVALTRAGLPSGRIYGVDLLGAAAGCVLVIPTLHLLDAPSAMLVACSLGGLAGAMYGWKHRRHMLYASLSAALLAGMTVLNASMDPPPLRPVWSKGKLDDYGLYEWVGWNSYSRVTVEIAKPHRPSRISMSEKAPPEVRLPLLQRRVRIDGEAATWIARNSHLLEFHGWTDWDLCGFAHQLRSTGPSAVIGVGGGRDVISAVRAGHEPVVGIDINPLIVDLHTHRMEDFSGLASLPGVELVASEARSYLGRDRRSYAVIVMSLIDTWAAQGAGAFSLAENGLYTVEAWDSFLSRLQPGGIFSVSRWFFEPSPHETARMLSLACQTLFSRGVKNPRDHIALLRVNNLATLLVSPAPFSSSDLLTARREASRQGFELLALPGQPTEHPLLRLILEQGDSDSLLAVTSDFPLDLTPPTDDRPFFFNVLKPGTWFKAHEDLDKMDLAFLGNMQATQTLVYATVVSLLLTLCTVVGPLLRRSADLRGVPRPLFLAACTYFALIGLGFMFVEIGLLSRLSVFLGHPSLALAVLLGGMILFAGLGSLLSGRLPVTRPLVARLYPALPFILASACALVVTPIQQAFAAGELPLRVAIGLALVAVPALGMGICFPLGLRLVAAARRASGGGPDLGPWLWGINGAFGVCASALALATSMLWGIHTTLMIGSLCYLGLFACVAVLERSIRPR